MTRAAGVLSSEVVRGGILPFFRDPGYNEMTK
jgi:hypothetical protein